MGRVAHGRGGGRGVGGVSEGRRGGRAGVKRVEPDEEGGYGGKGSYDLGVGRGGEGDCGGGIGGRGWGQSWEGGYDPHKVFQYCGLATEMKLEAGVGRAAD